MNPSLLISSSLATIPGAPVRARAAELENPETGGDATALANLIAVVLKLAGLAVKPDDDFDQLYIDAAVNDHQKCLDEIDNKLMKNASNDEVKSHLSETRAAIATHQELAKEIQSEVE